MRSVLLSIPLGGTVIAFLSVPSSPSPAAPSSPQGAPVSIVETFDNRDLADLQRTGAAWGGGDLRAGHGGGSGRLGDLFVPAGATVVLDTTAQDLTVLPPDVYDPRNAIDGDTTVTGGFFDFASVTVGDGGVLKLRGQNPARILARGQMTVIGTIDAAGGDAPDHDNADPFGGPGGVAGPGASAGGRGADQPDSTAFAGVAGWGGFSNPSAIVDGAAGGGIPEPNALAPTSFVGGGGGGLHHPSPFPADPFDVTGVEWDIILVCQTKQIGGIGGGGGYRFGGTGGENGTVAGAGFPATPPPAGKGGDGVAITPAVRELLPERGLLRGGSGGGGGGAHMRGSSTNGKVFQDCLTTVTGTGAEIITYFPSSGAGGGGGGGGLEVVAGAELDLSGALDASGGAGGSQMDLTDTVAGGGGSGGSLRLVAGKLVHPGSSLVVEGGAGGVSVGAGEGGHGSPGLIHVATAREAVAVADLSIEAGDLAGDWGAVDADIASTAVWIPERSGPAALSGGQSCWHSVPGATSLAFEADQPGAPGWDMTVDIPGVGPVSWRDANPILPNSLEETLGTELFTAPLVVRFQGARSAAPVVDPCALELSGPAAGIVPGSLTPWVKHPAELNALVVDPAKKPDLIRFQVLFDRDKPISTSLEVVLDLTIQATPR